MLYYLITTLYILACLAMMLTVYLQQGKGGDIAAAFGGGGSSQAAFGARSGATVLSRATTVCAVLFMVLALTLGIVGRRGPGSVIGGRAPLGQPVAPATAPVTPVAPTSAAPAAPAAPAPAR